MKIREFKYKVYPFVSLVNVHLSRENTKENSLHKSPPPPLDN